MMVPPNVWLVVLLSIRPQVSLAINQMSRVFRNIFLHLGLIVLILVLSGCAAKQAAGPQAAPSGPTEHSLKALPIMGHAIQVGAFTDPRNAVRLTERLFARGLAAYYFRGEAGLYRVRFGNYPSSAGALASARQLQKERVIDEFVVIRPKSYPVVRYRDQVDRIQAELVSIARQFIGVPYQWGDVTPVQGFDCSGLAMMVYQLVGLDMPRISRDQFRQGQEVGPDQLRPGDLVFFTTDRSGQASHVGIYLGNDQFIHAPRRGKVVSRAALSSDYFRQRFLGARTYL